MSLKIKELSSFLYDARFIRIVEILHNHNKILSIYFIRLITKKETTFAKKYINRLEIFKNKMRNPLQYLK